MSYYVCDCGTRHEIPMYAVAQTAMHRGCHHHCQCGRVNKMTYGGHMVIVNLPPLIEAAEAQLADGDEHGSWQTLLRAAKCGTLRGAR